jgi:RNA polymerase sigma-70 factor (ECF subfamily)
MKDFESLWWENYPALRRLAASVTVGREDAEDLLGNTALKALKAFGSFERGTSFHNWACRVMANVWLNTLRDRARRVVPVSLEDLDPNQLVGVLEDVLDDPLSEVLGETLSDVLNSLDHRDVLVLVAVADGSTAADIAERTGQSASGTRARLCRARDRASRALEA